jgi:acid phosphatase type 7
MTLGCTTPEEPDNLVGGEIEIDACGYSVKTVDGASRPRAPREMVGPDPTPFAVHLGVAKDPSTQMTIVWRTRDELTEATTVQLGDQSVEGFTFFYETPQHAVVRIHEAHLCGLQPDTEYRYRVGGAGVFSEERRFRTAPVAADAEVLVLVIGDTREGYGTFRDTLSKAIQGGKPDLMLFNGDAILFGLDQADWDKWFAAADQVLPEVPIAFAHGNHEINAVNYYSQFALPGDEQNYGFDFGPAHITVLNDTPRSYGPILTEVPAFLDKDMTKAAAAPWKLAMHHKTLWSATTVHPPDMMQRAAWSPIIDKHHVDLVLAGHDHDYERSKPLKAGAAVASPAEGTVYVTVGSAGAPLYEAKKDFFTEISETTHSYVMMRARRGRLQLDAFRGDGSQLDSLTFTKP